MLHEDQAGKRPASHFCEACRQLVIAFHAGPHTKTPLFLFEYISNPIRLYRTICLSILHSPRRMAWTKILLSWKYTIYDFSAFYFSKNQPLQKQDQVGRGGRERELVWEQSIFLGEMLKILLSSRCPVINWSKAIASATTFEKASTRVRRTKSP